MGQLGDVLEVLFGPDDRVRTVRATVRHWLDHESGKRIAGRAEKAAGGKLAGGSGEPAPRVTESMTSILLDRPAPPNRRTARDQGLYPHPADRHRRRATLGM